jgi:hypothetical protein
MRTTFLILTVLSTAVPACDHVSGHRARSTPDVARSAKPTPEGPMSEVAIAIPIRAGKTDAWLAKLAELTGPRYDEYESSRRRFGLTSQTTFLQRTPMGDFALIHLTGDDVHASFHRMAASQDPWDVSWRGLTLDLHGVDFAKGDDVLPVVEPAFSMESGGALGARPFMFLAPLAPAKRDDFRALAARLMGEDRAAYVASRARIGVRREAAFLEHTKMGDAVVFYWLADDPAASLEKLAASTDAFDARVAAAMFDLHPLPPRALQATIATNVLVGQYPKR